MTDNKEIPEISIIIPIYNEEKTIVNILNKFKQLNTLNKNFHKYEIICINDGSTDISAEIIKDFYKKNKNTNLKIILLSNIENKGKGFAIKNGFKASRGKYVAIQDADDEYEPKEIFELFDFLKSKTSKTAAIFGSRYFDYKNNKKIAKKETAGFLPYWGGILMTKIFNLLTNSRTTDVLTCHKVFPKEAISNYNFTESGFGWEIEITSLIHYKKYPIYEKTLNFYHPRSKNAGKKFKIKEGLKILFKIPLTINKTKKYASS